MKISYKFGYDKYGDPNTYTSDFELPETCPCCSKHADLIPFELIHIGPRSEIVLLVKCHACNRLMNYIYNYKLKDGIECYMDALAYSAFTEFGAESAFKKLICISKPKSIITNNKISVDFGEFLNSEYSGFVKVYNEALQIDQEYSDSAMIIYRRALEILVKDYLVKKGIISQEQVEQHNFSLNDAIEKFPNDRIKSLMNGARIIGNDFTHYSNKYTDYDKNNMRKFLDAILGFIDSERVSEIAEQYRQKSLQKC